MTADFADYILSSLKVLKPPEKITVTQWADKYRILGDKTSAEPGRWRTERTPYLKGIMDAFTDYQVEQIIFIKPTQVGGTECMINMIGYVIDQDPGPGLVVDPTTELAEYTSDVRIKDMIFLCPSLAEKFDKKSKILELQFQNNYISLTGANSASALASKPIRYLFLDEVDKYPPSIKRESNPRALAIERTKTFAHNKKIFQTSTPTTKTGAIWEEYESCDSQYYCALPCPYCGEYQRLEFKQLIFDKEATDKDAIAKSTYYKCKRCERHLTDKDKFSMLQKCEWRTDNYKGRGKIGFHLNSMYSPWVRFSDVSVEFANSKKYIDKLQNFYNSWMGEPFEIIKQKTDPEKMLRENQSKYTEGTVPDECFILTAGIDVQEESFYFTIRGWGNNMASYNITHGNVETWNEIDEIMNAPYLKQNGEQYFVELGCVDSGDQTEMVYNLCALSSEWAIPIKGSSTKIFQKFRVSEVKKEGIAEGMMLITVDGGFYKDFIFSRIFTQEDTESLFDKGRWYIYDGCDLEYCEQVCSEQKTIERRGGVSIPVWKPKGSHVDNHYLDCEVYAALAADILNIREMEGG